MRNLPSEEQVKERTPVLMVLGVGIDIIEVERVQGIIERHGDRFLDRVYRPAEIAYCRKAAHPYQSFATRFAAKEAVLKALGVGWQKGARFLDVVVSNNDLGAPSIELAGRSLEISRRLGVRQMFISLSHTRHYAVAQAVAEGQAQNAIK
jgi:holo-[acyl-carrier protein] synthase